MSYGPQPGYPPPRHGQPYGPAQGHPGHHAYGPPQGYPGYGPPPRFGPPSTAMAYVSAGLFLVCAMLTLITAIVGWDGASAPPELLIALVGAVFTVDLTNNVDFAILASMTVACSTLSFAIVQFFRLDFARWVLGFIGALVTVYYVWAIIRLSIDGLIQLSAMVFVSFVLWAAATVLVLLPATGRAMRGYHRKLARYPQQYPPQPPQQMGYPY